MDKKIMAISIGAIIGIVAFYIFYSSIFVDNEGPVINTEGGKQVYKQEYTNSDLLEGITAIDDEDGDVTDYITIKNIVIMTGNEEVKVTYAAKDKSNNITTKSVILKVEGEISDKVVNAEVEKETPEKETPEKETPEKETPEKANDEVEKINEEEVDRTGIPAIQLKQSVVEITAGSEFEVLNYVERTYDDGNKNVHNRIHVNGEFDVNVAGSYILTYTVSDSERNISAPQKLTLIVK